MNNLLKLDRIATAFIRYWNQSISSFEYLLHQLKWTVFETKLSFKRCSLKKFLGYSSDSLGLYIFTLSANKLCLKGILFILCSASFSRNMDKCLTEGPRNLVFIQKPGNFRIIEMYLVNIFYVIKNYMGCEI